jgi:hypothetical protein
MVIGSVLLVKFEICWRFLSIASGFSVPFQNLDGTSIPFGPNRQADSSGALEQAACDALQTFAPLACHLDQIKPMQLSLIRWHKKAVRSELHGLKNALDRICPEKRQMIFVLVE